MNWVFLYMEKNKVLLVFENFNVMEVVCFYDILEWFVEVECSIWEDIVFYQLNFNILSSQVFGEQVDFWKKIFNQLIYVQDSLLEIIRVWYLCYFKI